MIEDEAFLLVLEKTPETDKKTNGSQNKAIQNSPSRQKNPTRFKVLSFGHIMRRQGCFEKSITPEKVEGGKKRTTSSEVDGLYLSFHYLNCQV